jgi:hypothetical protein
MHDLHQKYRLRRFSVRSAVRASGKRLFRIGLALLTLLATVLFAPLAGGVFPDGLCSAVLPTAWASILADYQIESYRVDCEIQTDGGVMVQEAVQLYFQQDTQDLDLVLKPGRARQLRLLSVAISAPEADRDNPGQLLEVLPAADSPGLPQSLSYQYNPDDPEGRLRIRAISQAGARRLFVIRYQLDGALTALTDAVKFRRTFFSLTGERTIRQPLLLLHFPTPPDAGSVWFQPVCATPFLAARLDAATVQMSAVELPAHQTMDAVLILPPAVVRPGSATLPQGALQDQATCMAAVTEEARRLAHNARRQSGLFSLTWLLLIVAVFVLSFLILVTEREGWLFLNRSAANIGQPSLFRPAVLASLAGRRRPGPLLLGTLLDLVERGKLRLDGHVFTRIATDVKDYAGMAVYEIFLLQWFFERVTLEPTLSTAQIRKYALDRHTAPEFAAYYEQLIILIEDEMAEQGLTDPAKRARARSAGGILAGVYTLAGLGLPLFLHVLPGLLLLIPAGGFLLYGFGMKHLTREGYRQASLVRAFRRQLKNPAEGSATSQAACPERDAACLPQAVALGVSRPYLNQLAKRYGEDLSLQQRFLERLTGIPATAGEPGSFRQFADDLEIMESMLSASLYLALGIHFHS